MDVFESINGSRNASSEGIFDLKEFKDRRKVE
jgi:hypothetical protein